MNPTPERTSKRQREVLAALDRGLDAEAIAEELGITENTLRQLTRRLLARFPGRVVDLPANARKAGVAFEVSSPVTAAGLSKREAAEAQEYVETLDREPTTE